VPKKAQNAKASASNGANVGYEAQLWQMANALRNSMEAAEYKDIVFSLIFIKYFSDAFQASYA
jgi:type I restriction enzyme M protein